MVRWLERRPEELERWERGAPGRAGLIGRARRNLGVAAGGDARTPRRRVWMQGFQPKASIGRACGRWFSAGLEFVLRQRRWRKGQNRSAWSEIGRPAASRAWLRGEKDRRGG